MSYLSALQQSIMCIGSLAKAVPNQAFSYLAAELGATFMQWEHVIAVGSLLASDMSNPIVCCISVYTTVWLCLPLLRQLFV